MIRIFKYSASTQLADADYVLDKVENFNRLLPYLYGKLTGRWVVDLVGIPIKDVISLVDSSSVPDALVCNIYVAQKSLDRIALLYPRLFQKESTVTEQMHVLTATLPKPLEKTIPWKLYGMFKGNWNEIEKAMLYLCKEAKGDTVTANDFKTHYNYQKIYYTTDVLKDFLTDARYKWTHFDKWVSYNGEDKAYYTMRKVVKSLLKSKRDYLHNKDVKEWWLKTVPMSKLVKLHVLFTDSTEPYQLLSIMLKFERSLQHVYLQ